MNTRVNRNNKYTLSLLVHGMRSRYVKKNLGDVMQVCAWSRFKPTKPPMVRQGYFVQQFVLEVADLVVAP